MGSGPSWPHFGLTTALNALARTLIADKHFRSSAKRWPGSERGCRSLRIRIIGAIRHVGIRDTFGCYQRARIPEGGRHTISVKASPGLYPSGAGLRPVASAGRRAAILALPHLSDRRSIRSRTDEPYLIERTRPCRSARPFQPSSASTPSSRAVPERADSVVGAVQRSGGGRSEPLQRDPDRKQRLPWLTARWPLGHRGLAPNLAVAVRRLRDGSYARGNLFFILVPVAGIVVLKGGGPSDDRRNHVAAHTRGLGRWGWLHQNRMSGGATGCSLKSDSGTLTPSSTSYRRSLVPACRCASGSTSARLDASS